jgi:hypothetical protein
MVVLNKEIKFIQAVPLLTMQAITGKGSIAPTHSLPWRYMGVSSQRHASAALSPGKNLPGAMGMSLRAGLDTEAKGKILCSARDRISQDTILTELTQLLTLYKTSLHRKCRT